MRAGSFSLDGNGNVVDPEVEAGNDAFDRAVPHQIRAGDPQHGGPVGGSSQPGGGLGEEQHGLGEREQRERAADVPALDRLGRRLCFIKSLDGLVIAAGFDKHAEVPDALRAVADKVLNALVFHFSDHLEFSEQFDKDSGYVCTFSALVLKGRDVEKMRERDNVLIVFPNVKGSIDDVVIDSNGESCCRPVSKRE